METLGKEGEVNVTLDKRTMRWHARFRFGGRQYDRSTGETNYKQALKRAAEIFSEVVRGPVEVQTVNTVCVELVGLKAEILEMKAIMRQMAANGFSRGGDLSNPNIKIETQTLGAGFSAFQKERDDEDLSQSNETRLRRRLLNFVSFVGENTLLHDLTPDHIAKWLKSRPELSQRAKRNDILAVSQWIRWCGQPPRRWCDPELGKGVRTPKMRKKSRKLPQVISPKTAANLLRWVEANEPQYILFYAIALLAGVRANKKDTANDEGSGEIIRLFDTVKREGWKVLYNGLVLRIPFGKVGGESRPVHTPENLKAWLETYPDMLEVPHRAWHSRNISKAFDLPPNSLRHTSTSAYISSGGSFGTAAMLYGNSEEILTKHYVNLMTKEDADAFWQIFPSESPQKPADSQ
ncbi:hypothetical protein [Actomonas aquatica]|uniref:Core-binding (CB) domain-containing protein n=1 Tax=Actomonas aquatica TaxID=2866162 RepID=A0ABZ1C9A1_9BACT|nr:hypothetical protein [Opitutus sp. WL0086]WRQ88068.1 hypothetical protein K1X11_001530 [Opitutus sp. WL0086]